MTATHDGALVRSATDDVAVCRRILARGSRSFWAASLLLPARIRGSVASFYAFCRVADDLVDESSDPARAVAALTRRVDDIFAGRPADDPVDRALAAVVEAHEIPRAPLDAVIDGFEWDAEGRQYETLSDVLSYSARVASAVGVVMTYIMGCRDRPTLARACDLGSAMQLTNICRDVGEDARRGRLYLPRSWLREAGGDPDGFLRDPAFAPPVAETVQRLLTEAERLYARARPGIAALPADCRPAIRAAAWIYADIGRVIAARGFDSIERRARTGTLRKVALGLRAWFTPSEARAGFEAPALPEVEFLVAGAR